MTKQRIAKIFYCYKWTGYLLLCLALTLTIAGVLYWPILVYGAAPCFFCAAVLLIEVWLTMPSHQAQTDHNERLDVLEMVF